MITSRFDINDIKNEYDRIRRRNSALLDERREEVYAKVPEIKDLELEAKLDYISQIREKILKGKAAADNGGGRSKSDRVRQLLLEHGYPEDYLMLTYDCPLCRDTGAVNGVRCSCYNKKITEHLLMQSNLGNVLKVENFDTFNLDYYSSQKWKNMKYSPRENAEYALGEAKRFADSFESGERIKGMLIYGETGLGKTFLSNCIAERLIERGRSVLYLSANQLFNDVIGAYLIEKKEEMKYVYELVKGAELLIIDDLGTEMTNNLVNSQLFEVINIRAREEKPTLISTNRSIEQLKERYQERILSRILADYTVICMYGDNVRYTKRKMQLEG